MDIIKMVIPAAGLGTRFFPFTKTIPKEMLPILNKPAIQYIVQEGIESDISHFLMILNKGKHVLSDHFDSNLELEVLLKERGKLDLVDHLKKIQNNAFFTYIRQPEPLGLGHAIWMARHSIGKEYFGICLPDEIIINKKPALAQLIKIARQEKGSVIAVQEVPMDDVSSYGIIGIKKQLTPNLFQVSHLVEKPKKADASSQLAVIGRYVLSHKIFPALENTAIDAKGELQLTDGIRNMLHKNEKVFAYKIQGIRYDIGNPIGWIKANIGCALQDPQYEPYISKLLEDKQLLDSYICNRTKIIEHLL